MKKIILASQSPYRKDLLTRLNIEFLCIPANIDEESIWEKSLSPKEVAEHLSHLKANHIFKDNPEALVIGSDQVISLDNQIFGKPGTNEKAIHQLLKLKGKEHSLISGVCLKSKEKEIVFSHETKLTIKEDLSLEQIQRYVEADQPLNCAGSYKIEGLGISLFDKIETTDFSSIIGLPLIELTKQLNQFGVLIP